MLQTRADAEEVVQEAWLRLAKAEDVRSPEGFLLRATTRLCLDREKSARRRRESYVGPWLAELVDTHPTPDLEAETLESLNLGLLHVLLTLPPLHRAVFLLREAFDYPYEEIGRIVGRRPDACRQIARRARDQVRREGAETSVDAREHTRLLEAFLDAARAGETARLERLLADDVVLLSDGGGKAVAATKPVRGANNVARFLAGIARRASDDTTIRLRTVNGSPAAEIRDAGRVSSVFLLHVHEGVVRRVFAVRNPDKLAGLD